MFSALMMATVVHSITYFDYKIQVLDFAWQILIFVVIKYLFCHKNNCLLSLKTKNETIANDKISEYQTILNTFPEGFFMASFKNSEVGQSHGEQGE